MSNRPNLLFILTDQQRRDSMKCYGNRWIQTPNLDALAQDSFVFENAYVTQPVCAPARASIMTGLYPQTTGVTRNGIALDDNIPTLPEMISDEYVTAHFGKWHLGNELEAQHGFDNWISIGGIDPTLQPTETHSGLDSSYTKFLRKMGLRNPPSTNYEEWAAAAKLPEKLTPASFLGLEASQFINEHAISSNDRPFLLFVNFFEPHPPYTGPLNNLYSPDEIEVGPSFMKRPENGSLVNQLRSDYYMAGNLNPLGVIGGDFHDITTETGWRKLRAQYFANITLLDKSVGKIIDALHRSGLANETIVVFTSEHGEMAGDHGMLEKRSLYEEACRVPLLIRVPWLKNKNTVIGGNFSQVDLLPTLLDLLRETPQVNIDGVSREEIIKSGTDKLNTDVFLQWNGVGDRNLGSSSINQMIANSWRSVVTRDRWKLNLSPDDNCELFDLNSDPYELTNLYKNRAYQDRIQKMSQKIRSWLTTVGDDISLPQL